MQKRIIALLLFALPVFGCAQKLTAPLHWYNITQYGSLIGKNYTTYSVQTITGVSYAKYNAGIGVAYDKYGYESVPVFVDLRYNLLGNKHWALQAYTNPGVNIPVRTKYLEHLYNDGRVRNSLHPSFYSETGVTFSARINKKVAFNFGAGFNYKTFKYTEITYTGDASVTALDTDYTYHYSKLVLRVGFGFR